MFTDKIKKLIEQSVLCWLATVDKEGVPSVSLNSLKNILYNPNVCVSLVHIFKQKGFKIYGNAVYLRKGDKGYQERYNLLQNLAGDKYPIQGVIKIWVSSIKPILAPSYVLFPEITEKQQIESAKKIYGV